MNLWTLRLLTLSHYLIDQSHSLSEMFPIPYGAENGTDGLRALRPSQTVFTEFQNSSSGNWFFFGVLNCHMTLFPWVPFTPIRNRKWKACFVNYFYFVNLTSDIEQSSQNGTQKNDQPLVFPLNGIRFSFLFLIEWRHSIYTMLGRNEKEATLKTSSFRNPWWSKLPNITKTQNDLLRNL